MTDQMTFYHSGMRFLIGCLMAFSPFLFCAAYETGQEYKELMNDLQVKLQDVGVVVVLSYPCL